MRTINYFFLLFTFFTVSCDCGNKNYKQPISNSGKVVAIIDGDTYDILIDGNKKIRVRMQSIDAPEKGMPFYWVAKEYLGKLCFGKNISLVMNGKDDHNRIIAYSYLENGTELSHEMIKGGLAWHFKKYSSDTVLANLEIKARNSKIGLWLDEKPMPPWVNRSLHRQGISTKDSFNVKE